MSSQSSMTPWRWVGDVVSIDLLVSPGARKNAIGAIHDGRLKVFVTAPPEDGAANEAVIALFAKLAGVAKSRVELTAGFTSRRKQIRISGCSQENVSQWLAPLVSE